MVRFGRGVILFTLGALLVVLLLACGPTSVPLPTQPTGEPTTTSPSGPPSSASNTAELQADLADGVLYVNSRIVSDGTLRPPAGAKLIFGLSGVLVRTINSTGSAIDVSSPNVRITNLRVIGSDPCYWTNTLPYNPAAVGERYSQYDSRREEQAALYTRAGSDGLVVDGLFANDVWGDGVTLLGGKNLTLRNVNVRCAGRTGISNVDSSGVIVDGGSVSGTLLWGLNIEPTGSRSVSNYVVKNFTMGFTNNQWLYVGGPGFNCKVSGVDLRGVSLLPQASHQPFVSSCAGVVL